MCWRSAPLRSSGRSVGTGWVVFESREEALNAKKQYNNMLLDDKPMVLKLADEVVGAGPLAGRLSSGLK